MILRRFRLPRIAVRIGALFAIALRATAVAGVMNPIPGDPLTIDTGKIQGTRLDSQVKAYFAVPFAAPPVRQNRWRAPQPVEPWAGVYNADTKPAKCVQSLISANANFYFGEETTAEDCLYLNLWLPASARAGDKLPVVVWIYGGGFTSGSASNPVYAGEALARKGVIYVAANYRLGVFGFLAHPELTAESGRGASGNWGFLDQVASLEWLKRNIATFGGDPTNITLVGESAGAMSINNLQASQLGKNLFRRVFAMSGTTLRGGPSDLGGSLKAAEAEGLKLQAGMKAASIADMRAMSWDKVSAAAQMAEVRAGPAIDGYFLKESPDATFAAGRQNDVTIIVGSTANDLGTASPLRAAKTVAEYNAAAKQMFGDKAADFLRLWPVKDDRGAAEQADQVGRNSGFTLGARNWARMQTASGKQAAYLLMFSRAHPVAPGIAFSDFDPAKLGASHGGDVPYYLGTYEAFNLFRRTRIWTPVDRTLSEKMQSVIVNYARTGDPSTSDVKFVKYDPNNEQRIDFGDEVKVEKLNTRGMDFLMSASASVVLGPVRTGPAGPP